MTRPLVLLPVRPGHQGEIADQLPVVYRHDFLSVVGKLAVPEFDVPLDLEEEDNAPDGAVRWYPANQIQDLDEYLHTDADAKHERMRLFGHALANQTGANREEEGRKMVMRYMEIADWCSRIARENCWVIIRPQRSDDLFE